MQSRSSDLGYAALGKESTKGTAVIPSVYVPIYSQDIFTQMNYDEDTPIIGNKAARFQNLVGQRGHTGSINILAEPNTAGYIFDMMLQKGSTTGTDPYTHPFTLGSTNPNSYTLDISFGHSVARFSGVEASSIANEFSDNKMQFSVGLSALHSFIVREVASISTATITLKTNYDPAPTKGLVVGDLLTIEFADGTTEDAVVDSIPSDTTVTLAATPSGSVVAGNVIYLRPQSSPSYSLKSPFSWARTEYRFGATAAAGLSATQTHIDESTYTITHNLSNDEGEKRSGSFDPIELARTRGDVEMTMSRFFDSLHEMNRFNTNTKRALVVRHFSDDDYELRLTLNNFKVIENPTTLNTGEIIFSQSTVRPEYDDSDGQMFDVKVINGINSI